MLGGCGWDEADAAADDDVDVKDDDNDDGDNDEAPRRVELPDIHTRTHLHRPCR